MSGTRGNGGPGPRNGLLKPPDEGPADLRLTGPALAAWAAAAAALGVEPHWTGIAVAACLIAAVLLLHRSKSRSRFLGTGPPTAARNARTGGPGPAAAAAMLLCAAGAATSAGLHAAELHRGPVPELAARYAEAMVEAEVAGDARLLRTGGTGGGGGPGLTLLDIEIVEVTAPDGTVTRTRTPALVIVSTERAGKPDTGRAPGPQYQAPALSWDSLLPSTRVRVRGRLSPPRDSGDRVAAVLRVTEGEGPEVVGAPSVLQRTAGDLRAGLRKATDGLDPDARALLPGLVVGDTSRVPEDLKEAFRATDLTHLLAVSGANLTIVLALLLGPPGIAHTAERRGLAPRIGLSLRVTALCGGMLTIGFVIVCRPEPSVLRAAACGAITLAAIATGRRRSLLPALSAAALFLVLYDPWLSRSFGFLLSVLATGALLTVAPCWSKALRGRGVPPRLAEALAAAAAAQAVCSPVVAVLASRVSLVAVPCNLLTELAVAPATVLGFATLATAQLSMPLAEWIAWCAGWPVGWIASVARAGAALPGAGVDWPGGWGGGLLLGAVMVLLAVAGRRILRSGWAAAFCVLCLLLVVLQPPSLTKVLTGWPPPGWRFVMCDIGQGDAAVLAAGTGAAVVVDAGPDPVLVDRCLTTLGITRVPLVLLTHFHTDHVAGLPGILRGRQVGTIETTTVAEPLGQSEFVHRLARSRGIPVREAVAGQSRRIGDLRWQVLWPQAPPAYIPEGANNASVTLLVRTAGLTLFLPGDLEPPAQRSLLENLGPLPPVDVLKVAHHGSAHQEPALLRTVAPRLALVSAGADNDYGHPAPGTLADLREQGVQLLRTDLDGSIAILGKDSWSADAEEEGNEGERGEGELRFVTRSTVF